MPWGVRGGWAIPPQGARGITAHTLYVLNGDVPPYSIMGERTLNCGEHYRAAIGQSRNVHYSINCIARYSCTAQENSLRRLLSHRPRSTICKLRKALPSNGTLELGCAFQRLENTGIPFGHTGVCNAHLGSFGCEESARKRNFRRHQIISTPPECPSHSALEWTLQTGEGLDWSVHSNDGPGSL